MTTTRKLTDLFRALAAEDITSATALAEQLCALEEQQGHRGVARQLRGALHANGNGHSSSGSPRVTSPGDTASVFSTALVRLNEPRRLAEIVLTPKARHDLNQIVLEWTERVRLEKNGIFRRSKLLFHGPPGCGKSLTAQALGQELRLPVYMIRFDAVIGAFLGQTAIHLRQLFHFAETTPCVLLLDELDALGKRRGNPLDVGELDRIVISLLQELEHSKPLGLIVATTNLPKHLDEALWRRFDMNLEFKAPRPPVLRKFILQLASKRQLTIPQSVVKMAVQTRSFAAAERAVIAEIRRKVLESSGDE